MFDKMKKMASGGALDKVVGMLSPELQGTLESIKQYNVADLQDDEKFGGLVSKPALMTFTASAGGVTSIPKTQSCACLQCHRLGTADLRLDLKSISGLARVASTSPKSDYRSCAAKLYG